MVSEWNQIVGTIRAIGIWDILDIAIVAVLIYQVIKLIRETRAMQLTKGLVALSLLYLIAYNLNMKTIKFIMQNVVATGVLTLVIIFQPELRRMLEHVAQTKLGKLNIFQSSQEKDSELAGVWSESISVIAHACEHLSKTKTGALIVFERETKLGEIIKTGTIVDATPSDELIGNLFFVNTPLHDGAMIIRDGRIFASGCFLPLSQNYTISKEMGTRHRAALGMSENSDAVIVVVSEETGTISVAQAGVIERNFTIPQLENRLRHEILHKSEGEKSREGTVKALLRRVKR
ncbi:MAG: diadenylate cyclase CdaA [Negativibacillus sp.]|nr:diadenylate cyclase CdaA [Negativibacillus sp.]